MMVCLRTAPPVGVAAPLSRLDGAERGDKG